MIKVAVI